jgi:hypothetical protein
MSKAIENPQAALPRAMEIRQKVGGFPYLARLAVLRATFGSCPPVKVCI